MVTKTKLGDSLEAETASILAGNKRRRSTERMAKMGVQVAALLSLLVTALIVVSLFWEAFQFVATLVAPSAEQLDDAKKPLSTDLLWGDQWSPSKVRFDIKTLLVGSVIVTVVAMAVATPLGLGAAVYLSEYAKPTARKILKPVLEVLAGIPSIVIGFFALRWISPTVVGSLFSSAPNQNFLAAGLGVGLLTVPLVASISEDALRAVPKSLRQASAGLGARKKTTTLSVVMPAAVSGLVAALIVGTSRAIGETMVVFIAAGGSGNSSNFTVNPLDSGATMTAAIASQAGGTDNAISEIGTGSLFFVGAVLFIITLLLNVIADRFVRRVRQRY